MTDSSEIADAPSLSSEDVVAFLRDNPKFLSQHPQACDYLVPPKSKDKKVTSFQDFMIKRLKDDKEKVLATTQNIVENVRSNMNNQQRVHAVILRLLEARNFDEFIHIITMDMASMLNTDISVLVIESNGNDIPHIYTNGIRVLPEGTLSKWMGDQSILLQSNIGGIEAIFGGGATLVQSQALLRIEVSEDTPPAILAFGSRDPLMFQEGQGTEQIEFLARVVERCFRSWLR